MKKILHILLSFIIPLYIIFFIYQMYFMPMIYSNIDAYSFYQKQLHINFLGNELTELILSVVLLFLGLKSKVLNVSSQIIIFFIVLLKGLALSSTIFNISVNSGYYLFWLIISVTILTVFIFKRYDWNFTSKIKENDVINDGVFLIVKKPKSLIEIVQSLFGYGVGGVQVLSNKTLYKFSRKSSTLIMINNYDYYSLGDERVIKIYDDFSEFDFFVKNHNIVGSKYHFLKNSCLTVWKPVFNDIGINVKTTMTSIFVKEII